MSEELRQPLGTDAGSDDRELVTRAAAGQAMAFDRLMLKYRHQVLNLCTRLLGNRTDGEDAAQETFVKVYRSLGGFKGESQFSTWLYRVAYNTCHNRRRSWWWQLRRRSDSLDAPVEGEEGSAPREIGDERFSPEEDLRRRRTAAAVKAALQRISVKHRELVVLRDVQDMSYEEMEQVTGLSMGTVKSRLNRAREALKLELKGLVDGL
jgi:RNA polymerase sigma-70 factor, ECF subfamily